MRYVIDAGVAVKWFIPEVDSAKAHQLLERYLQGIDTPVAPDLLIAECGNVFWRRCRQGDITPDEATESLALGASGRDALAELSACLTLPDVPWSPPPAWLHTFTRL